LALIYLIFNKPNDAITLCNKILKKDSENIDAIEVKKMVSKSLGLSY